MNTVYKNHKCIKGGLKNGDTVVMDPKVQYRTEGRMVITPVLVFTLHKPGCLKVVLS